MKESLILLCLLVFSSCGRQELGDRNRNYDNRHGYNDDRYDRDDRDDDDDRNRWWPW